MTAGSRGFSLQICKKKVRDSVVHNAPGPCSGANFLQAIIRLVSITRRGIEMRGYRGEHPR